ncbi:MAG: HXXEE domain-containing protein [Candidatus Thorarchaeota archaeon]
MKFKEFIIKYNLEILTIVNAILIIYSFINWSNFEMTRRFVVLFTLAITLHEWEEGRFPGGFVEMMTSRMGGDIKIDPHLSHIAVDIGIVLYTIVPFFFNNIVWLFLAPMILGLIEMVMHSAGIKIFHLKKPYTPGLISAILMGIISILAIAYLTLNIVTTPLDWIVGILYTVIVFAFMEIMVFSLNGINPKEMIKNFRTREVS